MLLNEIKKKKGGRKGGPSDGRKTENSTELNEYKNTISNVNVNHSQMLQIVNGKWYTYSCKQKVKITHGDLLKFGSIFGFH